MKCKSNRLKICLLSEAMKQYLNNVLYFWWFQKWHQNPEKERIQTMIVASASVVQRVERIPMLQNDHC